MLREIDWDYPTIAVMLAWRLAPNGFVMTRGDLHALPMELVLLEDRSEHAMSFSWVTLHESQRRASRIAKHRPKGSPKAGVSQLQGRWQKIVVVLLWKYCKDGITLTQRDRDALPSDRIVLAHGHADDIEYRFVPREEAVRVANWERDNEGKNVAEHL